MDEEEFLVFVVDDDISNLKIAGTILSENGMRVVALGSGQALLERLKKDKRPDIILLDVLMPVMDGFQTFSKLRDYEKENNVAEIPVAFLTAEDSDDTREKAISLGAIDLIRKPFNGNMLIGKLRTVLSGNNIAQPEPVEFVETNDEQRLGEMRKLFLMFDERNAGRGAYRPNRENFGTIYRYMIRHIGRYNGSLRKVLVFLNFDSELTERECDNISERFGGVMSSVLRNSDVVYRVAEDKFLVLLPMASGDDIGGVIGRISSIWNKEPGCGVLTFQYVSENVGTEHVKHPEVNGLDYRYAQLNLPTDKMLTDSLNDFICSMPDRMKRLCHSFDNIESDDNISAYRIEVHAMKSASAMVGLLPLSGLARLLEGFSKESNIGNIRALHPVFIEEWNKSYKELCGAFGIAVETEKKDNGAKALNALLDVLRDCIENLDTDGVDRTMKKISSYTYDEKTTAALEDLKRAAIEFDDSAFDIIKELKQ